MRDDTGMIISALHPVRVLVLMCAAVVLFVCGCATTQDIMLANERIFTHRDRLENAEKGVKELRERDAQHDEALQEIRKRLADLSNQVRHEHEQVLMVEARIEEYKQLSDRSSQDTERKVEEASIKLDQLSGMVEKLSQEVKAVQESHAGTIPHLGADLESLDEESFYNRAYEAFMRGEFDAAQALFNAFLAKYPRGKFSDNARFWIGESLYRRNRFEEAILEYEKVKKDFPSGDKVPAALLKQALSFLKLNRKEEATILLKDLIRHYPQSEQAGMAKEQLEKLK
ncbi:MAG: tol-pal system protein YbgF [bacterium]